MRPTSHLALYASIGAMDQDLHVEKLLRCRKCYRCGIATFEATRTGHRALVALSDGFHRRIRTPLNLPPEIVCDCGTAQPDYN